MEATARQHLGIQQEPDQNNLLPPPQHPPHVGFFKNRHNVIDLLI